MGDKELIIACAHSLNFSGLSGTVKFNAHKDLFSSTVCLNVVAREKPWISFIGSCPPWFYYLFNIYGCFACFQICEPLRAWCLRGQKSTMGLLVLELQIVMSQLWVLGLEPRSSRRAASVLISEPSLQPSPWNLEIGPLIFPRVCQLAWNSWLWVQRSTCLCFPLWDYKYES